MIPWAEAALMATQVSALSTAAILGVADRIANFRRVRSNEESRAKIEQLELSHQHRMKEIQFRFEERDLLEKANSKSIQKKLDDALALLSRSDENQRKMRDGIHGLRDSLSAPELDRKALALILDRLDADLRVAGSVVDSVHRIDEAVHRIERVAEKTEGDC